MRKPKRPEAIFQGFKHPVSLSDFSNIRHGVWHQTPLLWRGAYSGQFSQKLLAESCASLSPPYKIASPSLSSKNPSSKLANGKFLQCKLHSMS